MENGVIKTAGRVFEVLEYFREMRKPLAVRDVSEHLGYPLSSTAVLLKSIATLGYLSYDGHIRAYFPTARLAMLGDWIFESMFYGTDLIGALETLSQETGETAILGIQNDIYAQYAHVVLGKHTLQFNVAPGTRRILCMSGVGFALLSGQPDAYVSKMIQRTNTRLAKSGHLIDSDVVFARVNETRKLGYAFSKSTVTPGVGVIAMPLQGMQGNARLAIGVGGLMERLEGAERKVVEALRSAILKLGETVTAE